jgi:hypothetical protein
VGKVRVIPQTTQDGQQSGLEMLEITYGGNEAPFGGIDSSAPAAYIDPRCFADCEGFIIVDNKLVVVSLVPGTTPTLWNDVAHVKLLKFGTFYSSIYGQLNYALGYKISNIIGPPAQTIYTFYITSWNSKTGVLVDTSILNLTLYNTIILPVAATLTLPVLQGEPSNYIDSGLLGIEFGASGVSTGSTNFGYTPGKTVVQMVVGLAAAITAASGTSGYTAAPSLDGLSIVLTAVTPGTAGNNLQAADISSSTTAGNTPAFYLPSAPSPSWVNLQGGKDQLNIAPPQIIYDVSTAEVGGTLYIANLGPFILKYAGPSSFAISTAFNGVQVLGKFAGSLIGLGTIKQLGTVLQNADMIFSWSSALNLDEWSPIDAAGNVTGAGFTQLGDIADYLSGLVVSNNTAFIIRSQGLSYAIATSNGTQPFQINHIGLGEEGEGAQFSDLVCQYDQTGAYVGNTDVFQVSGSISSIGAKIKAALFNALEAGDAFLSSASCAVFIGGDTFPLVLFLIDSVMFIYNPTNGTWTKSSFPLFGSLIDAELSATYLPTTHEFIQSAQTLALQTSLGSITPQPTPPGFWLLQEGVKNQNSISNEAFITFPQEELLFGRDVTIDALYISLWANVSENTTIQFYFNSILFSSLVLTPGVYNTLAGNPIESKIFPNAVFTSHSPQLQIKIVSLTDTGTASIRFSKIQEYATFEPNQRPV